MTPDEILAHSLAHANDLAEAADFISATLTHQPIDDPGPHWDALAVRLLTRSNAIRLAIADGPAQGSLL